MSRFIFRIRVNILRPGKDASSLSEEDELFFHVLHAFRHILLNWCRLAWLLEIARFVESRSKDDAFWRRFCDRIGDNQRLSDIAGVVFSLISSVLGVSLPPAFQDLGRCRRESLVLWVARFGQGSALENFSSNKDYLFLYQQFVQNPEDWRAIHRMHLFTWRRPPRVAQSPSPRAASRAKAALRQWVYVARRLVYHSKSAILYAWESFRWKRILSGGLEKVKPSP